MTWEHQGMKRIVQEGWGLKTANWRTRRRCLVVHLEIGGTMLMPCPWFPNSPVRHPHFDGAKGWGHSPSRRTKSSAAKSAKSRIFAEFLHRNMWNIVKPSRVWKLERKTPDLTSPKRGLLGRTSVQTYGRGILRIAIGFSRLQLGIFVRHIPLLAKPSALVGDHYPFLAQTCMYHRLGEILHPKEGEASARGDGAGGSQEDPASCGEPKKQLFLCRHIQKKVINHWAFRCNYSNQLGFAQDDFIFVMRYSQMYGIYWEYIYICFIFVYLFWVNRNQFWDTKARPSGKFNNEDDNREYGETRLMLNGRYPWKWGCKPANQFPPKGI